MSPLVASDVTRFGTGSGLESLLGRLPFARLAFLLCSLLCGVAPLSAQSVPRIPFDGLSWDVSADDLPERFSYRGASGEDVVFAGEVDLADEVFSAVLRFRSSRLDRLYLASTENFIVDPIEGLERFGRLARWLQQFLGGTTAAECSPCDSLTAVELASGHRTPWMEWQQGEYYYRLSLKRDPFSSNSEGQLRVYLTLEKRSGLRR